MQCNNCLEYINILDLMFTLTFCCIYMNKKYHLLINVIDFKNVKNLYKITFEMFSLN